MTAKQLCDLRWELIRGATFTVTTEVVVHDRHQAKISDDERPMNCWCEKSPVREDEVRHSETCLLVRRLVDRLEIAQKAATAAEAALL
jgi:hypothetical protein